MPRTPEAQKAYNDKRAATLAEAKDLENKGQHHLMTEAHVKAITTYRKSLDTRSSREKAAKEALVSGNTSQKIKTTKADLDPKEEPATEDGEETTDNQEVEATQEI
jgi:hypothetical protein